MNTFAIRRSPGDCEEYDGPTKILQEGYIDNTYEYPTFCDFTFLISEKAYNLTFLEAVKPSLEDWYFKKYGLLL